MAGSGGKCRLSELAFICGLGTGLHPWPWNWPSSAACWAGLRILCEMVTVRGRSEMVTPASNCSVEARTKLKMALWPHLDRLRRLTLVLGFSPQPLESLAWTFVPLTQRSGIQASCPGAPGEAWAPSSHTGKVPGLSASPWFWCESKRPSLCAWGCPPTPPTGRCWKQGLDSSRTRGNSEAHDGSGSPTAPSLAAAAPPR